MSKKYDNIANIALFVMCLVAILALWILATGGVGIVMFFMVGPCHGTELGMWGARGLSVIWLGLTPVYLYFTIRAAYRAVFTQWK